MKKNVAWMTIGNIYYNFCQWLMTVLVVRLASYSDAGYLAIGMSVSNTCATLGLFNMRNYQVTDVKERYTDSDYLSSRVFTSVLSLIVCFAASFSGKNEKEIICINLFMLIRLSEELVDVLHGMDQKYNHYEYIGISYLLRGTFTILGFTVCLTMKLGLAVAIVVIGSMNLVTVLFFDGRKVLHETKSLEVFLVNKKIFALLQDCVPLVAFSFLMSMINTIAKTVLQHVLGSEVQGIYSSIASPTLVVQVFAAVAFSPFLPKLSKLYTEQKFAEFQRILWKLYLAFAALMFVSCVGAQLLGKWGLGLLYGNSIVSHFNLLLPVVLVTLCNAVVYIMSTILIAIRKIKWIIIGMVCDFLLFVLIVDPCIYCWGANGASFSQIISFICLIPFMIGCCEVSVSNGKKRIK